MEQPSLRVSDADREAAVSVLREHLAAGRLDHDEFSERVGAVLAARRAAELAEVLRDLPELAPGGPAGQQRPVRLTAAVFGHVVRRGPLRLPESAVAACMFGDLDLDFREAAIAGGRAAVTVVAVFGNVDVYLPEGIEAEVSGVTILGHRRDWGRQVSRPGGPALRIRVLGCAATVDVWRVPAGLRGSHGDILRELELRQRELPG
jgi:hypothetical protein